MTGPHVKHMSSEKRQKLLKEQYFFECDCSACVRYVSICFITTCNCLHSYSQSSSSCCVVDCYVVSVAVAQSWRDLSWVSCAVIRLARV